jgi:hypothetical protein
MYKDNCPDTLEATHKRQYESRTVNKNQVSTMPEANTKNELHTYKFPARKTYISSYLSNSIKVRYG